MTKRDLLERANKIDNDILALTKSGRKMYPETLKSVEDIRKEAGDTDDQSH